MSFIRRFIETQTSSSACPERRRFLGYMAGAAALPLIGLPELAEAAAKANSRMLAFKHLHTGESMTVVYKVGHDFVPQSLRRLSYLLRDFRTGDKHHMDTKLYDLLWRLNQDVNSHNPYEIISAYRSPKTNQALRNRNAHSGVAQRSLHLEGAALDVRLADVRLADLRDAALDLKAGGVGYYPESGFIHVDTGRVRRW